MYYVVMPEPEGNELAERLRYWSGVLLQDLQHSDLLIRTVHQRHFDGV